MPRPGAAGTPLPGILTSCGGEYSSGPSPRPIHRQMNSIPIMIRALRGQLSHRRTQAQFQRILRDPDPRLRAELLASATRQQRTTTVLAGTRHTPGRNSPTMFPTLNTTRARTGRRTLTGILAPAVAILTMLATSTPAGATSPRLPEITTRRCPPNTKLEFNPEGADFPANSTRTIDTSIFRPGASDPSFFGTVRSPPEHHAEPHRIHRDREGLSGHHQCQEAQRAFLGYLPDCFDHADRRPAALSLASFWIYTDHGHHGYSHDLVTNVIS